MDLKIKIQFVAKGCFEKLQKSESKIRGASVRQQHFTLAQGHGKSAFMRGCEEFNYI